MQKSIQFRGESLEYEIKGTGMPVMLVHGFTEDRRIWHPLLKGLENKYKWILPDLPGSGHSSFNKSVPELKDFAESIHAIADFENIDRLVLIGHSMGGYISLAFAEKYPERISALGLFHSSSYADSDEKKEARDKNIRFIQKHGSPLFIEQAIPGLFSDYFKSKYPEEIRKLIERYANFKEDSLVLYLNAMKNRPSTTSVLKSITKPVLFIMGEEDKAVPLKDALEQCHLPQISYIHILTQTAHMGMIENTSLCNSFVDQFLGKIPV
ncbi:MAG TPA: alpha/beta hydrolase [Puia sp.]|nr:alpha/beta hydrolase [Puia sp.]